MRENITGIALAALLALGCIFAVNGGVSQVLAKSENPVRERQKIMRSFGKGMKTMAKMAHGKIEYDPVRVSAMIEALAQDIGRFPDLFPKGSDMDNAIMDFDHESSAKPDIWDKMDDFRSKAAKLAALARQSAEPAGQGKEKLAKILGGLHKACKACHEPYKAKDEDG